MLIITARWTVIPVTTFKIYKHMTMQCPSMSESEKINDYYSVIIGVGIHKSTGCWAYRKSLPSRPRYKWHWNIRYLPSSARVDIGGARWHSKIYCILTLRRIGDREIIVANHISVVQKVAKIKVQQLRGIREKEGDMTISKPWRLPSVHKASKHSGWEEPEYQPGSVLHCWRLAVRRKSCGNGTLKSDDIQGGLSSKKSGAWGDNGGIARLMLRLYIRWWSLSLSRLATKSIG